MRKRRIFISSVQAEFAQERQALFEYIVSDPLLGKFFDPFLFEHLPAYDSPADRIFLREVEQSEIYLGLLGVQYGFQNDQGISPTEMEFDHATKLHKTRLVFLSKHSTKERDSKQNTFINKAQRVLVRKRFNNSEELKHGVYAALIRYLEENEIIRTGPFDATLHDSATISDIESNKVKRFVELANSKRGFPLPSSAPLEELLGHLNLIHETRLTNAALLLFGNNPQKFFINSEVRCVKFEGDIVSKPIPSYKVFKGDVFQLVDQSVEFVLSKLDYRIGTRAKSSQVPGGYEIPKEIIAEAIVNAIAHRDYTSNASVQIMLFSNRIEIINPGALPLGWTTEKLKQIHASVPANPLLAEPMYLAGYIERLGTGTSDMIRIALSNDLKEPEFLQEDMFKITIFRPSATSPTGEVTGEVTGEPTGEVTGEAEKIVLALEGSMSRMEIQKVLDIKHDDYFRTKYIQPALEGGYIEMTFPERPNHPRQKYRLTKKGMIVKTKSQN